MPDGAQGGDQYQPPDSFLAWPPPPNWTQDEEGRENSSGEFLRIVAHVEVLIRNGAHDLIGGRSDTVARTIVAQLAHVHGFAPATPDGRGGGTDAD